MFHALPARFSSHTYLYEYVFEFVAALFEQFKSKRDHFQISEQLLLDLHDSVLAKSHGGGEVIGRVVDRDALFGKFEEYAECVHKYLPQIRQNNQFLLFHYIWTMQVQYMAPFFNFLCDSYQPMFN